MFSQRLAEFLITKISGIEAYAESFPAAKELTPQIVGIFSAGRSRPDQSRTFRRDNKRFMVSGSAQGAMAKAWEIFEWFYPLGERGNRQFTANEYRVHEVLADGNEPALVQNSGNIFYASFTLTFLVSRES